MFLIDSGNTHNFINQCTTQAIHYFVHPTNNFQVLIANGGLMKCGGRCLNVKLQMGYYHLKTHMFAVNIGGCDIVLGFEWLRTLGPITMDFKDLYMRFVKDSHTHILQGIQVGSPEIISSHCMRNSSRKGIHASLPSYTPFKHWKLPLLPSVLICNKYWTSIAWYLRFPRAFHPHEVNMITTFYSYQVANLLISDPIDTPLLKRMKKRK